LRPFSNGVSRGSPTASARTATIAAQGRILVRCSVILPRWPALYAEGTLWAHVYQSFLDLVSTTASRPSTNGYCARKAQAKSL
jgi:hypothetical protein